MNINNISQTPNFKGRIYISPKALAGIKQAVDPAQKGTVDYDKAVAALASYKKVLGNIGHPSATEKNYYIDATKNGAILRQFDPETTTVGEVLKRNVYNLPQGIKDSMDFINHDLRFLTKNL